MVNSYRVSIGIRDKSVHGTENLSRNVGKKLATTRGVNTIPPPPRRAQFSSTSRRKHQISQVLTIHFNSRKSEVLLKITMTRWHYSLPIPLIQIIATFLIKLYIEFKEWSLHLFYNTHTHTHTHIYIYIYIHTHTNQNFLNAFFIPTVGIGWQSGYCYLHILSFYIQCS